VASGRTPDEGRGGPGDSAVAPAPGPDYPRPEDRPASGQSISGGGLASRRRLYLG